MGGPWGSLGGPWGSPGGPLEEPGGAKGGLGQPRALLLGVLGDPWGGLGAPWGILGVPKGVSGSFGGHLLGLLWQRKIIENMLFFVDFRNMGDPRAP